jgi:hypothetical protein
MKYIFSGLHGEFAKILIGRPGAIWVSRCWYHKANAQLTQDYVQRAQY